MKLNSVMVFKILLVIFSQFLISQCNGETVNSINVMTFVPPNIAMMNFRCSGTAISRSHFITSATCVTVPPSLTLAVQVWTANTTADGSTQGSMSEASVNCLESILS